MTVSTVGARDSRRRTDRFVRVVALVVAAVTLFAVACIIVFFVVGGPFGALNDLANAGIGVLSAMLAVVSTAVGISRWGVLAAVGAVACAVVMIVGSALVMPEATGWYLARLVSATGAAFIGLWVLSVNVLRPDADELPRGTRQLGRAAAVVMLLGLLARGKRPQGEGSAWACLINGMALTGGADSHRRLSRTTRS